MTTVDDALLVERTQLLPEKLKVPVELPTVKVFRRYCRRSAPIFRMWLPLIFT